MIFSGQALKNFKDGFWSLESVWLSHRGLLLEFPNFLHNGTPVPQISLRIFWLLPYFPIKFLKESCKESSSALLNPLLPHLLAFPAFHSINSIISPPLLWPHLPAALPSPRTASPLTGPSGICINQLWLTPSRKSLHILPVLICLSMGCWMCENPWWNAGSSVWDKALGVQAAVCVSQLFSTQSLCASSIPASAYWESLIKFEIDKLAKISREGFLPSDFTSFSFLCFFLEGKIKHFSITPYPIGRILWIRKGNQGVWGLFANMKFRFSTPSFLILKAIYSL